MIYVVLNNVEISDMKVMVVYIHGQQYRLTRRTWRVSAYSFSSLRGLIDLWSARRCSESPGGSPDESN